jgi:hypothetical protein
MRNKTGRLRKLLKFWPEYSKRQKKKSTENSKRPLIMSTRLIMLQSRLFLRQ